MTKLEELDEYTFYAIYNLIINIKRELDNEDDEVSIPLFNPIIRYLDKLPTIAHDPDIEYCKRREQAIEYLKESNCIDYYEGRPKVPDNESVILHDYILIKINRNIFNKFCDNIIRIFKKKHIKPKSLKNQKIIFNDIKAVIQIGNQKVQLIPHKNEHLFYRAMFNQSKRSPISWDKVYEILQGTQSSSKEDRKSVFDTMYRINKRIKKELCIEENLFSRKNNLIIRNF